MSDLSLRAQGALKRYKGYLQSNRAQEFYSDGLLTDVYDQLISEEDVGEITESLLENEVTRRLLLKNLTSIPPYFLFGTSLSSFTIPDNVDLIESRAFSKAAFIDLIIPENIALIQRLSCDSMDYLERVYIEEGCEVICEGAFKACPNLQEVVIPDTVRYIEDSAFKDCPNVIIYCKPKSRAYHYAVHNDIKYVLI